MQAATHGLTLADVLGYALAFLLTGGLLGYLKLRLDARRQYVELNLTAAQTERELLVATQLKAQIEREDRDSRLNFLREELHELRDDCIRLRNERDAADKRVGELLIERQDLREEVGRLNEQILKSSENLHVLEVQLDRAKAEETLRKTKGGNGKEK